MSYTACRETSGRSARAAWKIDSVSACGRAWTASSTATRGRVTRSSAERNMPAKSDGEVTAISMRAFLE